LYEGSDSELCVVACGTSLLTVAFGAAIGAASMVTGAAILDVSGYEGYHDLKDAATIGAVGQSVVTAGVLFLVCLGLKSDSEQSSKNLIILLGIMIAVLSAMAGQAILDAADKTDITLAESAAAAAVGASMIVPGVVCCARGLFAAADYDDDNSELSDMLLQR
jgi:hypothetical protein